MARLALSPRTAFRLRTSKSEEPDAVDRTADARPDRSAPAERADRRRPLRALVRWTAMLCAFVFMVAFAVVLARLTLEPSPASKALVHTNLTPGHSLRAYLDQPELRDAVKQIGGNILLGVPFGILLPIVAPGTRGFLRILLLTAVVMLLVEFAQGAIVIPWSNSSKTIGSM
jgi:hypothetical protein